MKSYENVRKPHGFSNDMISLVTRYDYYTYKEILSRKHTGSPSEIIDDDKVKDFKDRVDYYFEENSPGDNDYRDFIKYISLYLTFIVKKSLHPVGIKTRDMTVTKENKTYYCTGKKKYIKDKNSLCKYCVSKSKR
jgi:uncharacterized protein (UPF0305 family)